MLFVFRAIDQGHHTLLYLSLQERYWFIVLLEFCAIPRLEFCPLAGFMAKPLAKLRAGCDILQPEIDACFRLRQASRPEPVNEDALPVFLVGLFIHPFDFDIHLCPLAVGQPIIAVRADTKNVK